MGTNEPLVTRNRGLGAPIANDPGERGLIAGLVAKEEAAFVTLLHLHQKPMLRIARTYVSNQATAEDVVQDTWLVVLDGVERFEGRSSLKTWMYRIVANRAKTAGQKERRCVTDSALGLRDGGASGAVVPAERFRPELDISKCRTPPTPCIASIEDAHVTSEEVATVARAINRLPAVQRLVITLRDVECWTAAEVCIALELSENNQRVVLHRARSKVRRGVASCPPPDAA
ncbi:MAG: sigma-70 family RNA polymerase sigma factor [Actinomycetota bacterium]|nr:sigma-70 family RNA polymerase sigma factor [Actinomycetota bacterium]